jgi:hypothetical protein
MRKRIAADKGKTQISIEDYLDKIEVDPDFQKMMAQSDEDFRAGRFISHSKVKELHAKRKLDGSENLAKSKRSKAPASQSAKTETA